MINIKIVFVALELFNSKLAHLKPSTQPHTEHRWKLWPACKYHFDVEFPFLWYWSYSIIAEANNLDIGLNIADDLEQLRSNLDKFKKSGMGGDLDIDIEQMDWVEDNRKVKAFFIYETSL